MNTITYSSNDMNNLWNYLQGLPISIPDRRWLANRLLESTKNESDTILSRAREAIEEMRLESEANGNSELSLDEINEEIRQARLERKKRKMVEA
ncbi:MAG: hypothetical protein IIY87_07120 [Bacteroidales bacterium]|jgi:hypothetical protein|nr:hypothetical protein [Bacteroidales bacterium]